MPQDGTPDTDDTDDDDVVAPAPVPAPGATPSTTAPAAPGATSDDTDDTDVSSSLPDYTLSNFSANNSSGRYTRHGRRHRRRRRRSSGSSARRQHHRAFWHHCPTADRRRCVLHPSLLHWCRANGYTNGWRRPPRGHACSVSKQLSRIREPLPDKPRNKAVLLGKVRAQGDNMRR